MASNAKTNLICLGGITGGRGIKGDVLITSYTEPPENIAIYGPLWDQHQERTFLIEHCKPTPKGVIAHIKGINTRNDADNLKGLSLYVPRSALPDDEADEDSWYHVDLIGLRVLENDQVVGEIIAVPNYGAGDLLEIKCDDTSKTLLIPFTKECVPKVSIEKGEVYIIRPEEWDGELD
ncbi:MAG: ribosome maturation factor RimM [Pseudomonadota bacterium]